MKALEILHLEGGPHRCGQIHGSVKLRPLSEFNYVSSPPLANCLLYVVFLLFPPLFIALHYFPLIFFDPHAPPSTHWLVLAVFVLHPAQGGPRSHCRLRRCVLGHPQFGQGVPSRPPYLSVPAMECRRGHDALVAP